MLTANIQVQNQELNKVKSIFYAFKQGNLSLIYFDEGKQELSNNKITEEMINFINKKVILASRINNLSLYQNLSFVVDVIRYYPGF